MTDTVTMYYLETKIPPVNALKDTFERSSAALTAATYSLGTWYNINSTCIEPSAEKLAWLQNYALMSTLPMVVTSPASTAILKDITQQPGLLTSPLCQCIARVLVTFNSKNPSKTMTERIKEGNDAYNACFSTNMHTPTQTQIMKSNLNLDNVNTRKTMSKVSLVLIICLSLAFNYVYSLLDFRPQAADAGQQTQGGKLWNMGVYTALIVIVIAQWLLPLAFADSAHSGNIIAITSLLIGTGIVFAFILAEYGWRYLKTSHRMVHIHPYVFYTTLASLTSIALFEHGVFDLAVFIYYILIAHAISFTYASTIFFAHFNHSRNTDVDEHTLMGHLAVFAAGAFLLVNAASPSFPMGCTINYMWVFPWVYTVYVFGFTIYLEHMMQNIQNEDVKDMTTKNLYSLGNSLVVIIAIGYYALKNYQLTFGDTILSNADEAFPTSTSVNFALNRNPGIPMQYLIN